MDQPSSPNYQLKPYCTPRDRGTAGILAIFGGILGLHHFYLGNKNRAIAYIGLTLGLIGIGYVLAGIIPAIGVLGIFAGYVLLIIIEVICIIEGICLLAAHENAPDFEARYVHDSRYQCYYR